MINWLCVGIENKFKQKIPYLQIKREGLSGLPFLLSNCLVMRLRCSGLPAAAFRRAAWGH